MQLTKVGERAPMIRKVLRPIQLEFEPREDRCDGLDLDAKVPKHAMGIRSAAFSLRQSRPLLDGDHSMDARRGGAPAGGRWCDAQ
jgi:hypothetical protein